MIIQMPTEYVPLKQGISSALALVEMRRAILGRVDVIGHIIAVANGEMPAKWAAVLDIPNRKDEVTGTIIHGMPFKLTFEYIMLANELLLKRILPEYRKVEVSIDTVDSSMSFESAKALMAATLLSAVNSAGGRYVDGKLIMPPVDAGREAGPIIEAVVVAEPEPVVSVSRHQDGELPGDLESLDPTPVENARVASPQDFPAAK